jgi:fatty acid desaturase
MCRLLPAQHYTSRAHEEMTMLDALYIAIVLAFFALLWGFTKASDRL